MNWEKYRRTDGSGTINLSEAFDELVITKGDRDYLTSKAGLDAAYKYLVDVESLNPVKSRQMAAIAIATAKHIARHSSSPV